jgi:hypothetical protein
MVTSPDGGIHMHGKLAKGKRKMQWGHGARAKIVRSGKVGGKRFFCFCWGMVVRWVYKGWGRRWVGWRHQHITQVNQVYIKSTFILHTSNSKPNTTSTDQLSSKMNNMDCHPRVLSLSSTTSPFNSTSSTPATQSRRPSHESAHDAHHFVNAQEKTHKSLNGSIKKMWKEIKQHASEHHKSVNAAYAAQYGAGARLASVI